MTALREINWRFWNKSDVTDVALPNQNIGALGEDLPITTSENTKVDDKADIRLTLAGYYLVIFFGQEKRSRTRLAKERQEHPVLTYGNAPVLAFVWLSITFTLYSIMALCVRSLSYLIA